jgi:hypothetical protein
MTPPQEAAAAFVAGLAPRTRDSGPLLTAALTALVAAERAAVREACAAQVDRDYHEHCVCGGHARLADDLRALPLD